ncbi:MAG: neutral/alkaline non-lysosomal ceramidase N-terminal domain-containing protein [Verrucomicrobiota bacterium]
MKSTALLCAALALASASFTPAAETQYLAGVARVDITPDYPVRLSGYGNRRAESDGIAQRIWAKALALGSDVEGPAILITVDNLGVSAKIRAEVVRRLAAKTKVTDDRFAIASSHTHTAPMLTDVAPNLFSMDIPPEHQKNIDRYTRELTDALEKVSLEALAARKPSKLAYAIGKAQFGKNRRTPNGPTDPDVPVLRVTGADGQVRAVLANYACHCTTLGGDFNQLCGDWATFAQEGIERDHPGAIALMAVGCGADQNPQPRTGLELAKKHGDEIAAEVKRLFAGELKPVNGALSARTKRIELPFDTLPTRAQWEELARSKSVPVAYHAQKNLKRLDRGEALPTKLPYLVQTWAFGKDLAMVFLPGEVVVDYAIRLKQEFDAARVWVNGYANDVPCYIPSRRIINEGGYEGGGAMVYYDRPTRFALAVEDLIVGAVHDVTPKDFLAAPRKFGHPAPKTPNQALASFVTKPGFGVELMAAEPDVIDPVYIDFAPDGKLWVVEFHDYPMGLHGNYEPGGRIKFLTDTNGDGRYDKSTLFLDGLPFPTGVMAWGKGALICAAPDILYAEDTNGDGKADLKKPLFTGFITDNYQARVNGLSIGLDNWVYGANGLRGGMIESLITGKKQDLAGRDFRMNPDTGAFELASGRAQQGRVRDDWGNYFGCANSQSAWHNALPDHHVKRNPNFRAPDPSVNLASWRDGERVFPVSELVERFNRPDQANRVTSGCGIGLYRDTVLGADYYGDVFTCEPVHNLVRRLKLVPNGVTFAGQRASDEQESEFFASTDQWCRPGQATTGPDGALWIVDMYRHVIEHPRFIPAERLAQLDPRAGDNLGRIYRVYPRGARLKPIADLTKLPIDKLVAAMDSSNGIERDRVQRELVHRKDASAVAPLKELVRKTKSPAVRVQAMGALELYGAATPEVLLPALKDSHWAVRAHAVRLSERFLGKDASVSDAVLGLAADADIRVRYQVAFSLGEWNDARATQALGDIARADMGDQWLRAAVLSSATSRSPELIQAVMRAPAEAPGRGEILGQLIATASVAASKDAFGKILAAIAPAKGASVAAWQLTALAGLQDALERQRIAIQSFASSKDAEVSAAAAEVERAFAEAHAIASDRTQKDATRAAAVRLFGRGFNDANADLPKLAEFLKPGTPTPVEQAALEMFRRHRGAQVPALLLAGWARYSPSLRGAVAELVLSRAEWTPKFLDAVEQGIVSPQEVPVANRDRLLRTAEAPIKERAKRLFGQKGSEARAAVLARYQTVADMKGDATKGFDIYLKNCASCHAMRGQGFDVGPDLTTYRNKPVADFLLGILDPNSIVEPRYVSYNVETKDDRSLSGVVQGETASSITIAQGGGVKETVLRKDITSIKASALSLMPEGLEQAITPQAMADLIAFIKETR